MTFHPDKVGDFLALFDATSPRIRAFPGCRRVDLWVDVRYTNILTTHSIWSDEAALDAYRASDLFKTTWQETRRWFAAPAVAHSHHMKREDPS